MLQAKQKAEEGVSTGIAQGEQASATAGREEFNAAVGGAENATKAFEPANEAAKIMPEQEKVGLESQASVDAAQKAASWSGIASKALTSAGGSMMGAAGQPQGSSPSGGSSPWGQLAGGAAKLLNQKYGSTMPAADVGTYGAAPRIAGGIGGTTSATPPSGIDAAFGQPALPNLG
jgi:hypothetical protein